MRILVVQESDWIARGPHQSHHLMERLSARGHEIIVVDFEIEWRKRGDFATFSRRIIRQAASKTIPDGEVTLVRPVFVRLPILDYLSSLFFHRRELSRLFKEFKPDVVVCFGILNAMTALSKGRRNRIPTIYYVIDELHRLVPEKAFRQLAKIIECRNMASANLVISINEALREYTIEMGATRNKTAVVRAGIDIERFKADKDRERIRAGLKAKSNDILIFFMGWLYEFSGVYEVAEQLVEGKGREENLRLLIIGKGELENRLRNLERSQKYLSQFTLLDWQPYDEIPSYLAASDICILPAYKNEIMRNIVPIKIYEYLAAGKPVISTELHGIMLEFGSGNGVVFVDGPGDVLNEALRLVKSNQLGILGEQGRRYLENSSWHTRVDEFEAILIGMCKNNS